ncbi:uncharacterized protein LOC141902183 [Tubulanus polymorphus]|uniref:uncharacterized protein LOC141902183 n=1 Tax=Tubulanus polymorphus TaxID=672921 RepID=UPI003DA4CF41
MGFFSELYGFIFYTVIDYFIFAAIDFVAKTALRDSRSDAEKRYVWLYEALVLFILGVVIYLVSHTPHILFVISFATVFYAAIHGRVHLHDWLTRLENRWDEFQQHEESMEISNNLQRSWNSLHENQVVGAQSGSGQQQHFQQQQQQDPSNRFHVSVRRPLHAVPPPQSPSYNTTRRRTRWGPPVSPSAGVDDRLTAYSAPNLHQPLRVVGSYHGASSGTFSLASKIRSAFSFMSSINRPPGLKNDDDENLCFMNSILQCLAHSPNLASSVGQSLSNGELAPNREYFVSAFNEVVQPLCAPPANNVFRDIATKQLQTAIKSLDCELFATGDEKQVQQDASEFLMWLLDNLHNAMDLSSSGASDDRFYSPTLAMLTFIYGDLTPQKIDELKRACLREIELSNGLDNDTHAEPMQRLSDLEWLLYKQFNRSAIDDLFTGQLVEMQNCLNCNRVSTGIQTFRVLPLPIVSPHRQSGIVFLEDCLSKFGNVEVLFGEDGLKCPCTNADVVEIEPGSEKPAKTPISLMRKALLRERLPSDSAVSQTPVAQQSSLGQSAFMSPITRNNGEASAAAFNDSGFQDNQIRTSTPVGGVNQVAHRKPHATLTNGQQRSLLRQLPDCLVVQLMRFQYSASSDSLKKIRAPMNIPLKNLDLRGMVFDSVINREDLTATSDGYIYDLYGLCVHLGAESTSCGHYIAFCQCQTNGTWYKFDDENITQVNMEFELNTRLIRENSYILFFKRRK